MPAQLTLRDVTKSYGPRPVLDRISLSARPGEHAGIVGENGSGKSTLLRLIAGVEAPDEGEVTVISEGGVGHLGQTLDLPPGHTLQQVVDAALAGLRERERRMRELEADLTEEGLGQYGELLSAYEARGGYEADARVDKALYGLGLAHLRRDRVLASLSGGERARLALACLPAASPEVLLLDEPTNHLSLTLVEELEQALDAYPGALVVVSHDRALRRRFTGTRLEMREGRLVS